MYSQIFKHYFINIRIKVTHKSKRLILKNLYLKDKNFFQVFVLSLNLFDLSVHCYIVRLPCMLYGRFLVRYDNYYYPGKIIEIQGGITEPECSRRCIGNGVCLFYDYFKHNKTCSLLSANLTHITKEMLLSMTDASFISSNYSSDNVSGNRGIVRTRSYV